MLSIQAWIKTLAAVSPNYLLGVCVPLARFLFCIVSSLIVALTVLYRTQRREPHLIFLLLPRREFVLSIQAWIKTPAAVSPNYLLGERAFGTLFVLYCFFFDCCIDSSVPYATPRATLDFFTATAQRICDGSGRGKNSCRSFAKLSAW